MFKYRLERVLDLREQELEKVKTEFQEAAHNVRQIEAKIQQNRSDQLETQNSLVTPKGLTSPQLYINRLNYLKTQLETLEQNLMRARDILAEVRQKMIEAQQKTEALKKHREKKKAEFEKEELRKEEIQLNELALIMRRIKEDQDAEE